MKKYVKPYLEFKIYEADLIRTSGEAETVANGFDDVVGFNDILKVN